jgi:hypothetical protein
MTDATTAAPAAAPEFDPGKYSEILPAWAKALGPARIEADPALFVPALLKDLAPLVKDGGSAAGPTPDQYWLEVVWAFVKLDLQRAVDGTRLAPPQGGALLINILCRPEWKHDRFPKGKGGKAALDRSAPDSARALYRKIRGAG